MDENLAGKIKGRPLVQRTLRLNHARGKLDHTHCHFPVQSLDTPANQILAAALRQSTKYLRQTDILDSRLHSVASFSANALNGVTLRRIFPADFQGLHYGGLLRSYRDVHRWARLVLRLVGFDPLEDSNVARRSVELPPFAINMSELFERYCEIDLRDSGMCVEPGYGVGEGGDLGTDFRVRPDFLVWHDKKAWIVDASTSPSGGSDRRSTARISHQWIAAGRCASGHYVLGAPVGSNG
jgi:5-methylcytosine-specific restriction endonuclease McrBC regulatory subunit McrC